MGRFSVLVDCHFPIVATGISALLNRSPFLTGSIPSEVMTPDLILSIQTSENDLDRLGCLGQSYPDVPIMALLLQDHHETLYLCEATVGVPAMVLPIDGPDDLERRCLEVIDAAASARTRAPAMTKSEDAGVRLTEREQEVLELLKDGFTNRQIGGVLGVSEHTVRAHMRGIMMKMNVSNRVQAVTRALSLSTQGGVTV